MSSLLVSIRSVFYPVSLLDQPARSASYQLQSSTAMSTPPKKLSPIFDPMDLLPKVPLELVHLDLDELLLNFDLWNELEDQQELIKTQQDLRFLTISIGQVPRSIYYPAKRPRRTCYDCNRPLWLYKLASLDPEDLEGPGWCPGCLLHLWWRQEHRRETGQSLRDGLKPPAEVDFIQRQEQAYLKAWNLDDQRWWENEQGNQSNLYCAWLDRQLAKLSKLQNSSMVMLPE